MRGLPAGAWDALKRALHFLADALCGEVNAKNQGAQDTIFLRRSDTAFARRWPKGERICQEGGFGVAFFGVEWRDVGL